MKKSGPGKLLPYKLNRIPLNSLTKKLVDEIAPLLIGSIRIRIKLLVLPLHTISVFDALSIGSSLVAAVLLCIKREHWKWAQHKKALHIKEVGSSKNYYKDTHSLTFGTTSCLERQGNNLPAR